MTSATTPLPVIRVEQPCHESWDRMAGDERTRFCAHCQRHVHNLSGMREAEVADLICRSAGELCVRFQPAHDGRVMTLEYAPRRGRMSTRRWLIAGALAALAAGCGNLLWHRRQPPPPMLMGAVAPSMNIRQATSAIAPGSSYTP
jgi:hypothetical protein